jgi:hypothetical protein
MEMLNGKPCGSNGKSFSLGAGNADESFDKLTCATVAADLNHDHSLFYGEKQP